MLVEVPRLSFSTPKTLLFLTFGTYKRFFISCLPFTYPPNFSDNMGMSYRRYLSGERIYGCSTCKTHLATIHSMMSRVRSLSSSLPSLLYLTLSWTGFQRPTWSCISFRCRVSHPTVIHCLKVRSFSLHITGISTRVNVVEGEPDDRPMTTGKHTVRDIYCCKCGTTLGWKYVNAPFNFPHS